MNIFVAARKYFVVYGIVQHERKWNARNWVATLVFVFGAILNGVYFSCEAKPFQEYADSVFVAACLVNAIFADASRFYLLPTL